VDTTTVRSLGPITPRALSFFSADRATCRRTTGVPQVYNQRANSVNQKKKSSSESSESSATGQERITTLLTTREQNSSALVSQAHVPRCAGS